MHYITPFLLRYQRFLFFYYYPIWCHRHILIMRPWIITLRCFTAPHFFSTTINVSYGTIYCNTPSSTFLSINKLFPFYRIILSLQNLFFSFSFLVFFSFFPLENQIIYRTFLILTLTPYGLSHTLRAYKSEFKLMQ